MSRSINRLRASSYSLLLATQAVRSLASRMAFCMYAVMRSIKAWSGAAGGHAPMRV